MILETIHDPRDIKALNDSQTQLLCTELREFLLKNVSKTGGHLASNLGAVELTVAIHRVFDTSRDRLVFDVGHQCYTHKILTGRREQFSSLRQYGGLSGFPKPRESGHDAFIAGHASNSVSVALGMARARTLEKQDYSNYLALMKYYASRAKQEQDAALAQQKLEASAARSGSARSSSGGSRKASLSSTASESLERTMNTYLSQGDTGRVKQLFLQYRDRMTPLQKRRFEKLMGKYNIPMTE